MRAVRIGWVVVLALAPAMVADAGGWQGWMNVSAKTPEGGQGAYLWGSAWGVADLKTVLVNSSGTGMNIANNVLELYPNYNTYNPTDAYWASGTTGNKWMEANTFVQTSTISTPSAAFSGTVSSFSLVSSYAAEAFIKVLDPLTGYTLSLYERQPLTSVGTFSLASDLTFYQGQILQYGFSVSGVNANPAAMASNGFVRVITETGSTPIVFNVVTGSTRTQAQAGYPSIATASSVTKTGGGTIVFNGTNTYTGPTLIETGTLRVANAAGLSASDVTVNAGATLAVSAAGSTNLAGVTVSIGGDMALSTTGAQTVNVQSLDLKSAVSLTRHDGQRLHERVRPAGQRRGLPAVSHEWSLGCPRPACRFHEQHERHAGPLLCGRQRHLLVHAERSAWRDWKQDHGSQSLWPGDRLVCRQDRELQRHRAESYPAERQRRVDREGLHSGFCR